MSICCYQGVVTLKMHVACVTIIYILVIRIDYLVTFWKCNQGKCHVDTILKKHQ